MLAEFERPNVVVCVLCKGSVSVRKGDKTRFFNHISLDHEVHFDLELFYAISFMSDGEKSLFVEVMSKKLQRENNKVSDKHKESERTIPETKTLINHKSIEKSDSINDIIDAQEASAAVDGIQMSSIEAETSEQDSDEEMEYIRSSVLSAEKEVSIQDSGNGDEASSLTKKAPLSSEKPIEVKKEFVPKREKCRKCSKMILSKAIRIHMRTKHKMKEICCKLCNKKMLKESLSRHMRKVHKDCKECEFCEQKVLSSKIANHLEEVHGIDKVTQNSMNSPPEAENENTNFTLNIKEEKSDPPAPTLEEHVSTPAMPSVEEYVFPPQGTSSVEKASMSKLNKVAAQIDKDTTLESLNKMIDFTNLMRNKNEKNSTLEKNETLEEQIPTTPQSSSMGKLPESDTIKIPTPADDKTGDNADTQNPKVILCNLCKKMIKVSNYLRHKKESHSEMRKKISCPLCYEQFNRKDHLRNHMKNVHKSDDHLINDIEPLFLPKDCQFGCKNCELKFISNSSLAIHQQRRHYNKKKS